MRFTEKVKKLPQPSLAEFVELVQKIVPKAVRDLNPKKLQIRVDDIDKTSFVKLNEFLDTQPLQPSQPQPQKMEDVPLEPPQKIPKLD